MLTNFNRTRQYQISVVLVSLQSERYTDRCAWQREQAQFRHFSLQMLQTVNPSNMPTTIIFHVILQN
jgi:hypothetical protein